MISIVIPAYRGAAILEKQLPLFHTYMQLHHPDFEILVVDDGSDDAGKTAEIASRLPCRYLRFPENRGKGAAVRAGMLAACGDILLFTDVDIPFQYANISDFIAILENEEAELVVGDRTLAESSYFKRISLLRKLGSDVFSLIVSRIFTDGLHDTQCGLKAFKRAAGRQLFSESFINGFAFDVEILYLATIHGFKRKRLPVQLRCNESSSVRVLYHGSLMLLDLIIILFKHRWKKKSN